jgi:aminoglycoside phosphotransferase (APT) family kinase protein
MLHEVDVRRAIDACSGRLASATGEAAPVAHDLFAWLRANVPPPSERAVIVHGDVGLHNLLVDGDRVSVVLDWERAHLGDPTEDLVYLRPTLDGVLDWDEFMAAYLAAGGTSPGPDRERFYRVWQDVWRYVACMEQLASFEQSGRLSSAFAGRIYGPRFLASAAAARADLPRGGG